MRCGNTCANRIYKDELWEHFEGVDQYQNRHTTMNENAEVLRLVEAAVRLREFECIVSNAEEFEGHRDALYQENGESVIDG